MERNRSIVVFNHSVDKLELSETIPENFQGDIVIHGNLMYDYICQRDESSNVNISGNLWVEGNIDMEDASLQIDGDLVCAGYIAARELRAKNIECYQELRVRRQLNSDDVFCDALVGCIVNVCGDVVCNTAQIETLNVLNNYICFKNAQIESASIFGNCICDGRINSVSFRVSQNFMCEGYVDSFDFFVGGDKIVKRAKST